VFDKTVWFRPLPLALRCGAPRHGEGG